jgi:hypothetical protein
LSSLSKSELIVASVNSKIFLHICDDCRIFREGEWEKHNVGRNLVIGRNSVFSRIMAIGHNELIELILVFRLNKLIEPNDADPPNLCVEYSIDSLQLIVICVRTKIFLILREDRTIFCEGERTFGHTWPSGIVIMINCAFGNCHHRSWNSNIIVDLFAHNQLHVLHRAASNSSQHNTANVVTPFDLLSQAENWLHNMTKSIGRQMPKTPSRILDAPELVDDYYLNLVKRLVGLLVDCWIIGLVGLDIIGLIGQIFLIMAFGRNQAFGRTQAFGCNLAFCRNLTFGRILAFGRNLTFGRFLAFDRIMAVGCILAFGRILAIGRIVAAGCIVAFGRILAIGRNILAIGHNIFAIGDCNLAFGRVVTFGCNLVFGTLSLKQAALGVAPTSASEIINAAAFYYLFIASSTLHVCSFVRELALARKNMWWWIVSFGDSYHGDVLQHAKQIFSRISQ